MVKSESRNKHVQDLEKVFDALEATNMWLNLEKCIFRVGVENS